MATPLTWQTAARGESHRWKVLGVGVAANASFSAASAGIPTTAVWLRSGYHLGNAELGLALGAMGLGVAVSELPWGMLTDRWGDRPVLLAGLAATAAALFAMALFVVPHGGHPVPALGWLVFGMCLTGLVGGSVNGSSGRAVMAWFREGERGLAMSIRQTAVPLGGGLGALVLPWLAASHGFAAVYGVLAAMCAVSGAFAWRWLHEPSFAQTSAGVARAPAPEAEPLRDTQIWRVVLGIGLLCSPQMAVLTFATVFLHDAAHLGIAAISGTMAVVQAGAMAMRVWSGRYTDRRGNRRAYMRGSTLVAAASFAVLAAALEGFDASGTLLMALVAFAGICVSAWHGVAYTELATLAGTARAGTALGMANTAVYAGLFVTPLAIPHLLAAGSWGAVWFVAGLCALGAYPLFPKPRRP
ncbi:major facilitator transporter [Caballeronia arationis]|jgi:MFS family permease|uniref:Predicted arabinose efflux permease, MFS family n=1 Tax=Caballeronia arationis TaxID=1777142 RepID=A0A7Z7I521_9BURK|nr:MFS transporter [Caballeronia arationis]SAK64587.1 major facilitator transporter [Caballeronia arationis]SOE63498.1 Predicted arabinose efflux permease, MFS family [Caballeronia arationis]